MNYCFYFGFIQEPVTIPVRVIIRQICWLVIHGTLFLFIAFVLPWQSKMCILHMLCQLFYSLLFYLLFYKSQWQPCLKCKNASWPGIANRLFVLSSQTNLSLHDTSLCFVLSYIVEKTAFLTTAAHYKHYFTWHSKNHIHVII